MEDMAIDNPVSLRPAGAPVPHSPASI